MMEALSDLPALVGAHLQLTLVALSVALGISLPLGVLLARTPSLRGPALGVAGVLQTIPSLALLALMVPVFVGVHQLGELVGLNTPVLGFLPAVSALSIYGILPVLRNTVTGLSEVDETLVEAARGLGMTEGQVLAQVQLPLAAPIIFAGIRTAAVWVVGTATLATPVGQQCLGDLMFGGLQTRSWGAVILGCVAAAGLAVTLDLLLGAMERAKSGRIRAWIGGIGGAALLLTAAAPAFAGLFEQDRPRIVVGSKGFTEQFILARVLERRLEAAGYRVQMREGLGSTIIFDALGDGGVDVYVDYSGTVWANHLKRTDTRPAEEVVDFLATWVQQEKGATLFGTLGFKNEYAIAVRQADADTHGWETIADLARQSSDLTMGADYEFFLRPEWAAIEAAYGIEFGEQRTFDTTFLYDAVKNGEADAISAYTSDGRITAFNLKTLSDPERALPPYDAILMLSGQAAQDQAVVKALQPLVDGIDLQSMREANRMVDQDGKSVAEAAAWLDAQIGVQP